MLSQIFNGLFFVFELLFELFRNCVNFCFVNCFSYFLCVATGSGLQSERERWCNDSENPCLLQYLPSLPPATTLIFLLVSLPALFYAIYLLAVETNAVQMAAAAAQSFYAWATQKTGKDGETTVTQQLLMKADDGSQCEFDRTSLRFQAGCFERRFHEGVVDDDVRSHVYPRFRCYTS